MRDVTSTPASPRPGTNLLAGVIAAAGTCAMGTSTRSLHALAQTSHGHETLIIWVLLGLSGLGALLCFYLALIWGLAATIMLAGPASRTGTALLGLLRVLAPRVARRVAGGAAVATATTALTFVPGLAAQVDVMTDPNSATIPVVQTAELASSELPPSDPAPEAAAPGSSGPGTGASGTGAPLPPLGWGEGPAPAGSGAAPGAADARTTPAPDASGVDLPDGVPGSAATAPAHTVVVHQGDSLWSISEDLLGPGASDPAEIAAAWPLLHEINRDVIGDDPDQLRPGQELTVPASITTQDMP